MRIKQSEADEKMLSKTSKQYRNTRLILLISLLLISILISYSIWDKAKIDAAQKLVDDCSLNNNCFQIKIISALETLIQAQKNLRSFNLSYTNLEDANLVNADLYRTNLSNTNLSNANLSHTNLYRTNLSNANFSNTNLTSANLKSSNFKDAKNLTPTQIKSACNWEQALYKGRFDDDYEEWIIDKQANQQFIRQLQQDSDSDPKQSVNCSKWKHWSQDR